VGRRGVPQPRGEGCAVRRGAGVAVGDPRQAEVDHDRQQRHDDEYDDERGGDGDHAGLVRPVAASAATIQHQDQSVDKPETSLCTGSMATGWGAAWTGISTLVLMRPRSGSGTKGSTAGWSAMAHNRSRLPTAHAE